MLLLLNCFVATGFAMTVGSTFDFNAEGWVAESGEGLITYQSGGGNPGGFLNIQDVGPGSYVIYAPSKFKGDLSQFDGGMLSYDILQIVPQYNFSEVGSGFGRIQLEGNGVNATFDYAPYPPVPSFESWKTYYVLMTAQAWQTTPEIWELLLADVENFYITLDLVPGADTIGFDNFKMTNEVVPEPMTLALFGLGLVGVLARRKR